MSAGLIFAELQGGPLRVFHDCLSLESSAALEFIDLTEGVEERVRRSGIEHGIANVHCRHTSAAVVVNENEPLLLEDFAELLERLAPRRRRYQHDRFDIRTANLAPDERPNGHAHARALLLGASECLAVIGGRLELGPWQRIFLVELDGSRRRSVAVTVLGTARSGPRRCGLPAPAIGERKTA